MSRHQPPISSSPLDERVPTLGSGYILTETEVR